MQKTTRKIDENTNLPPLETLCSPFSSTMAALTNSQKEAVKNLSPKSKQALSFINDANLYDDLCDQQTWILNGVGLVDKKLQKKFNKDVETLVDLKTQLSNLLKVFRSSDIYTMQFKMVTKKMVSLMKKMQAVVKKFKIDTDVYFSLAERIQKLEVKIKEYPEDIGFQAAPADKDAEMVINKLVEDSEAVKITITGNEEKHEQNN